MTAGLRALPFVLIVTTGSTYASGSPDAARPSGELPGRQLICYSIRPGDTAARLAQRFTGSEHNRHQPWFQILNPATATFVPKSQYAVIEADWHVCVVAERLIAGTARARYHLVSPAPLPQTGVSQQQAWMANGPLWWAVPLFVAVSGLVLVWIVTGKYIEERRASVDMMRAFGQRFISEFERPLFRRNAEDPAVASRLRFAPARRTMEVLLAPAAGRTYPNLVDHRRNVEYDVERVRQVLGDEPFVSGRLYAEGPWVVIPFHFDSTPASKRVDLLFEPNRQEGVL